MKQLIEWMLFKVYGWLGYPKIYVGHNFERNDIVVIGDTRERHKVIAKHKGVIIIRKIRMP